MKLNFVRESKGENREPQIPLRKISGLRPSRFGAPRPLLAFTLLEVMIAIGIFFAAMFSILALVTQCVRSAHSLHQNSPTPGMVAAELSLTNKLEEGFNDGDFGDLYPDYTWKSDTLFYASNGMFQVDFGVYRDGDLESTMSILLYRPESVTGLSPRSSFSR